MAYMNADTSAKVGFRPYYQTDPFDAAHLSGLGQNHPFKPQAWRLHGIDGTFLGVYHLNRPFDPWELYDDVHHTAGVTSRLGLYAPSWFGIPTASSQNLRAAAGNMPGYNRGGGTIIFPGPGGPVMATPAGATRGLGYLGDGSDDVTAQAADELLASGHITQAEHDAILEGSMTFQDVLGFDPTDQSTFISLTDLLRETNSNIIALENQVREANVVGQTVPGLAQVSAQVNALRQAYNPVAQEYIHYYVMLTGGPAPSGLSGLGVVPVVVWWVVGSLAAIVTIILTAYELHNRSKQIDVHGALAAAQQTQAQANVQEAATNQQLVATMQRAQAVGDTVTAQSAASALKARGVPLSATGVPNPPADFSTWIMTNAKWVGLGLAGIIAIGPIAQGLFGPRRR